MEHPTRDRDAFADAWTRAIGDTRAVPMTTARVRDCLLTLTDRLAAVLVAVPFDPSDAETIGADLIHAGFTDAEAIGRTVTLLGTSFPGDTGDTGDAGDMRRRIALVQGAVVTGHSRARRLSAVVEKARRTSEARFRTVFERSAIGIIVSDRGGRVLEVNEAVARMFRCTPAEFKAKRLVELVHPDDYGELLAGLREVSSSDSGQVRIEGRFRRADGAVAWGKLTTSFVRDAAAAPGYFVAMLEDVTEQTLLQARLRHHATHDPLTGLANRTLFFEQLDAAFDDYPRVGVCFLDLDRFKKVNDSLGHVVGDQLLRIFAKRITTCVRDGDLVARMGGDEFVILVPDTAGPGQVTAVADRVLVAMSAPVRIEGHELSVTTSIGVVEGPVGLTTPNDLMAAADVTLNWAKTDGKNRWALFDPDRNASEVTRQTLSATMRAGLDDGEFILDYQPVVGLHDGRVTGVEALIRWDHPRYGRLLPEAFVPLAAETGLIVPIGRWVLGRACAQAVEWGDSFPSPAIMSVNIDIRQLVDPDFVADVRAALKHSGLEPGRLQLEVTESTFMDLTASVDVLWQLANDGVRVAIDDFGTGFSNLSVLRSLPATELKVAGPFIDGLTGAGRLTSVDDQILAAIVGVAQQVGLTVCAEGVETREQVERLRGFGCDSAQGRYFAAPGAPEVVRAWMSSDRMPAEGQATPLPINIPTR